MPHAVGFVLNRLQASIKNDGGRTLLWVLRTDFALTGTKYGCGEGHCGACTVILDGKAVRSCQTPLSDVARKHVVTIEGLGSGASLHPLQGLHRARRFPVRILYFRNAVNGRRISRGAPRAVA